MQQPAGHDETVSTQASVTGTSGPSPPSPAPPLQMERASTPPKQSGPVVPGPSSSPPIPSRNNMRNRVELDSVSPGIERPNPLVSPITPSSPLGHNFSYPARAPPAGIPRQATSQEFNSQHPFDQPPSSFGLPQQPFNHSQHSPVPPPQPYDHLQQHQAHHQVGFGDRAHPGPLRPGHQPEPQQKQSTLANLKTAAAGIHVGSLVT